MSPNLQHTLILVALMNSLFSYSTSSLAQNPAAKENQVKTGAGETEQKVIIKGKDEIENARHDATSKTVISNSDLIRFGDINITDALKRVPGILVVKDQLQLPGMGAAYTQVLIDGEPPQGITITDLTMNMIERVEIYRAGNAQFSSQAMAGTINIVLKRTPSSAKHQVKINATNGNKTSGNIESFNADKRGNFSYALSIFVSETDAPFSPKTQTITENFAEKNFEPQKYVQNFTRTAVTKVLRLTPRIQYTTNNGISFNSTSFFSNSHTSLGEESVFQFSTWLPLPTNRFRRNFTGDVNSGNSNLRALFSLENNTKFDIYGSVNRHDWKRQWNTDTFDNKDQLASQLYANFHLKTVGFNSTGKVTAPSSGTHDIVGAWSLFDSRGEGLRLERLAEMVPPNIKSEELTTSTRITKLAFFAQDEWKFRKDSSAYFGLRWESVRTETGGTAHKNQRHQSNVFSPIIQSLWQLNTENTDRLRFGVSRTYQAPTDLQLVSPTWKTINNSIQNPNFRGNPGLRPELAWSLDAAYEHNGKDAWNYNIRAKFRNIEDLHRESLSVIDGTWWVTYVNAGHALSKGIEIDTQFPLKRFVDNAPNIDFTFDLSKNWSRVSNLPQPYNTLSPISFSAKLGADYRSKDYPLNLGINVRHTDSRWQQINQSTRVFLGTPLQVDLYGLWKFSKQTQLRLAIDNLLKHRFADLTEKSFEDSFSRASVNVPVFRRVSLNFEHKF